MNVNSQEEAYAQIKAWTLSSRFSPSQRLKAGDIAAELRMSRTPVREALARLEQEGLVRRAQGWGYVVRELTVADVMNLYRVRKVLEVESALEALPNINSKVLGSLEKLLHECAQLMKQGQMAEFLRVSRRFHQAIAKESRNPLLEQMLSMINDRVLMVGSVLIAQHRQRAREILEENEAILHSLESRNAPRVARTVRRHVAEGYKRSMKLLLEHPARVRFAQAD